MTRNLIGATASPLASIFGSGFLVIVPVLVGATGSWAVLAMAVVCAVAFAVGSVIRFNIRHVEPLIARGSDKTLLLLDRCSDVALVAAYVVSVSLYLQILSSFVLGSLQSPTDFELDLLTTAIIVAITLIGVTKGLKALDFLEIAGLAVTLVIITLLIAAFLRYDLLAAGSDAGLEFPATLARTPWEIMTIVAGTLIVVQGFETPRYLGDLYDVETRVRASRLSQILSFGVYLMFVAVTLPAVHTLGNQYDDNSLIALVGAVGAVLVLPLVIAAALSQFSAAVADTHAATGNLHEVTRGWLRTRWGCIVVGAGAIALTWSTDTLEILAFASRAFALYYLLQCIVAFRVAQNPRHKGFFAVIAAILAFVTLFAQPAG